MGLTFDELLFLSVVDGVNARVRQVVVDSFLHEPHPVSMQFVGVVHPPFEGEGVALRDCSVHFIYIYLAVII